MKLWSVVAVLVLITLVPAYTSAAIQEEVIEYSDNGTSMKGFLAYDDAIQGKRPGVIVVHEWWGLNDYARKRARMLAELGYTALAVDMYGDGKTAEHPDDAGKFAGAVRKNMDVARARFKAGLDLLKQQQTVDPGHIAAIGYCFGGGIVLQMARDGADLDGAVIFHGSLATAEPARPGAVKAKVLVLTGAADKYVPDEQVAAFKQEMDAAGVDYKLISYPGAKHAFTNPGADANAAKFGMPIGYDANADQQSWAAMQKFFDSLFK